MKLLLPKISLNQLLEREITIYDSLDAEKYGKALSSKVAEKLTKSKTDYDGLYFSHRDYCGLGIIFREGKFIFHTVYDGLVMNSIIAEFTTPFEFIEWLSKESDQSMSLYGKDFNNQTITKSRLEWYLEDKYSPVWNTYCQYIRDLKKK